MLLELLVLLQLQLLLLLLPIGSNPSSRSPIACCHSSAIGLRLLHSMGCPSTRWP